MNVSKGPEFREIIERLRDKAKRKVPESDAEDLVQEVLVVLVERIQHNQPIDSMQAYADGVLRHVIYDYYQRKREVLLPKDTAFEQASPAPTPEQRVVWMRHLRVIEQLAEENRIDQSLMNEHFVNGAPLREVAHHLRVSPGVVNGRLYRFRQKLIKQAGSCFAWLLAWFTSLWHRTAHANLLSSSPQATLGSAGLLLAGSLLAWTCWTPAGPLQTTHTQTVSTLSLSASSLVQQRYPTSEARRSKHKLREKYTLSWSPNAAKSSDSTRGNRKAFTVLAHQAQNTKNALRKILLIEESKRGHKATLLRQTVLRQTVLRQTAAAAAPQKHLQQRQRSRGFSQRRTPHLAPLPSSVRAPGAQGSSAPMKALRVAASRPNPPQDNMQQAQQAQQGQSPGALQAVLRKRKKAPKSSLQKSIKSRVIAGASRTAPASHPLPPTKARPSRTIAHAPDKQYGVYSARTLSVVKTQQTLQPLHPSSAPRSPFESKKTPFTATLRHSFCIINDGQVYRCDSGKMDSISSLHGERFRCHNKQCRDMIGQGPTLIFTTQGELFLVGSRHFQSSRDNGLTWSTPTKAFSSNELLSQSSLVLNQQGELWQVTEGKWKKLRTKKPGVHEIRVHLDKGRLQVKDDAGFHFKQTWGVARTTSPHRAHSLSDPLDVKKLSPTRSFQLPSLQAPNAQKSTTLTPPKETPGTNNP